MAESAPQADKRAPRPEASVVGTYLAKLTHLLDTDKNPKEIAVVLAQRMGSQHFLSVLGTMTQMDRLYAEMRTVLDEFTGRSHFLVRTLTIEYLATVMKLYVISWHTMLDLLARLVSSAFDLGIADRDVSVRLVLSNDHVKSSRIRDILRQFEKALLIKDLGKRRNDVVHRGRIPDCDVEEMLKERNTIDSRRYSILESSPISDEEHKRCLAELQDRLRALAKNKLEIWEKIHTQTTTMTYEVAHELAVKTVELYKRAAI
jgi:HEPN superfamily protein